MKQILSAERTLNVIDGSELNQWNNKRVFAMM